VLETKVVSWVSELADAPGRQCTQLIRLEPSSVASTLWSLALASDIDWEAASLAVTNGSLKVSRKIIRSFELRCNFPFLWGPGLVLNRSV
jgi:hypothetical protein